MTGNPNSRDFPASSPAAALVTPNIEILRPEVILERSNLERLGVSLNRPQQSQVGFLLKSLAQTSEITNNSAAIGVISMLQNEHNLPASSRLKSLASGPMGPASLGQQRPVGVAVESNNPGMVSGLAASVEDLGFLDRLDQLKLRLQNPGINDAILAMANSGATGVDFQTRLQDVFGENLKCPDGTAMKIPLVSRVAKGLLSARQAWDQAWYRSDLGAQLFAAERDSERKMSESMLLRQSLLGDSARLRQVMHLASRLISTSNNGGESASTSLQLPGQRGITLQGPPMSFADVFGEPRVMSALNGVYDLAVQKRQLEINKLTARARNQVFKDNALKFAGELTSRVDGVEIVIENGVASIITNGAKFVLSNTGRTVGAVGAGFAIGWQEIGATYNKMIEAHRQSKTQVA